MVEFEIPENHLRFSIESPSDVGVARRELDAYKARSEFTHPTLSKAQLVISELGSNLLKYGKQGEILIKLDPQNQKVQIYSLDLGPGIPNFKMAFTDGFTTGSSLGTGLGAIKRIAHSLIFQSHPHLCTTIVATLKEKSIADEIYSYFDHHHIVVPIKGQRNSGDWVSTLELGHETRFLIFDGLGHGAEAAKVAEAIGHTFHENSTLDLPSLWQVLGEIAKNLRGGVIGMGAIQHEKETLEYFGMGNIQAGVYNYGDRPKHLISRPGVFGKNLSMPRPQPISFPAGSVFIAHSDGLKNITSNSMPMKLYGDNVVILASTLFKRHIRNTDDASILVIKN